MRWVENDGGEVGGAEWFCDIATKPAKCFGKVTNGFRKPTNHLWFTATHFLPARFERHFSHCYSLVWGHVFFFNMWIIHVFKKKKKKSCIFTEGRRDVKSISGAGGWKSISNGTISSTDPVLTWNSILHTALCFRSSNTSMLALVVINRDDHVWPRIH